MQSLGLSTSPFGESEPPGSSNPDSIAFDEGTGSSSDPPPPAPRRGFPGGLGSRWGRRLILLAVLVLAVFAVTRLLRGSRSSRSCM